MEKPQKQHEWLQQLVGDWTFNFESSTKPGGEQPAGTDRVRSVGGMWIVAETSGKMPDGDPMTTVVTIGFNPAKGKYVGTFIGSMMSMMWHYEGELDDTGRTLTLRTEGPSMEDPSKTTQYKDVITIKSPDEREFSSVYLASDGTWQPVMKMRYRRTK